MGFVRAFDQKQIDKMTSGENAQLFAQLRADVLAGEVFAAVRKNELYFYYKGGCLYKFAHGMFVRDPEFAKFGKDCEGLAPYARAKKEVENKYAAEGEKSKERWLLDKLNQHTFAVNREGNVVVLDIEVNLNGSVGGGKKCDMVLLHTQTDELMFAEGKVFGDSRVNVAVTFVPEVIAQVQTYTAAIAEQRQAVLEQYASHIRIINALFSTAYRPPRKLIEPAKLLVYQTPTLPKENGAYSIQTINAQLGANNVAWVQGNDQPTLDAIWQMLTEGEKSHI